MAARKKRRCQRCFSLLIFAIYSDIALDNSVVTSGWRSSVPTLCISRFSTALKQLVVLKTAFITDINCLLRCASSRRQTLGLSFCFYENHDTRCKKKNLLNKTEHDLCDVHTIYSLLKKHTYTHIRLEFSTLGSIIAI